MKAQCIRGYYIYCMSTPTKRRKPNSYKASPQTVGSIDFFFSKKKNEASANAPDRGIALDGATAARPPDGVTTGPGQDLTDEELARKLQLEWDAQDKVRDQEPVKIGKSYSPESEDCKHEKIFVNGYKSVPDLAGSPSERDQDHIDGDIQTHQSPTESSNGKDTLALQSTASAEDAVSSTVPFDENPLTFNPGKYLPELKRFWANQGGNASYGLLTRCFVLVNSTQSRIKIVDTLVNLLRILIEGDPTSLLPAVSEAAWISKAC